jgi:glycine/D-amino acid oxidase-like deaminating enzyme
MAKHQNYWFETQGPTLVNRSGIIGNADVLVIGGGVVGLLTLWQLLKSGVENVYLVDEQYVGYRASGRSSGQLMIRGARSFTDIYHTEGLAAANDYIDFIAANNEILRTIIEEHELICDLQQSGGLRLAMDDDELAALIEEAEIIENAQCGIHPIIFGRERVEKLVYSKSFAGGMYLPSEATLNPYKLVNQMAAKLDVNGRRILSGCCVESVTEKDNGKLEVVIRDKGTIRTKSVVYCTNAYTPRLLPELHGFMTSFRGQMIASDVLPDPVQNVMPQMSLSCNYGREYFRMHRGRMLMGGMRHKVQGYQRKIMSDGEVSRTVGQHLKNFMQEAFPYIKTQPTHVWSGVMCETTDGFPLIGPVPGKSGQYINAGFNGYGFSHALLAAYAIKDFVTKGHTSLNAVTTLFSPERAIQENTDDV